MNGSDTTPRWTLILGFASIFVLTALVVLAVFERRFSSGEIYPHYSTFRSDPLGSRALFDSLEALPDLEVIRNQRSLMQINSLHGDSTLWLCGLSRRSFISMRAPEESPVLRAVQDEGARLVITLNPGLVPEEFDLDANKNEREVRNWWEEREKIRREREKENGDEDGERDESDPEQKKSEDDDEDAPSEEDLFDSMMEPPGEPLREWLGVEIDTPDKFQRPAEGWTLDRGTSLEETTLPGDLPPWFSHLRFTELGDEWRVAANIGDSPVVIERRLGKGTVVLTSGSFFASNEALWKGAHPEFLLWLTGGKGRQVFDETIHGTVESGGVMKVIRRYRLHGFFYGLLIFIALMAWKSSSSLAPGSEAVERGLITADSVAGEETASGVIRLLKRSVPTRRLLRVCLETWRSTAGQRGRRESMGQQEAIDSVLASHENQPKNLPAVEAFERITHILSHPDDFRKTNRT